MANNKSGLKKKDIAFLLIIFVFILVNGYINHDSKAAMISAICGIFYTFIAGKGFPVCYLFGVVGSGFYAYLSLKNHLAGQLCLYLFYYIPMQIAGYFNWNKNLKDNSSDIVKINMPVRDLVLLLIVVFFGVIFVYYILCRCNDSNPLLDSVTTVFSLAGMYLTVRRAIEQWIFWFIVNVLSFIMWLNLALSGEKVFSTVIMWCVYVFLAVYFYISWKKEIDSKSKL